MALERDMTPQLDVYMLSDEEMSQMLPGVNPLAKVPALELSDGQLMYDSRVICEYLDGLHNGRKFEPDSGEERWRVLRLQALGDGVTDAVIMLTLESRRPANKQDADVKAHQMAKIDGALTFLENHLAELTGELNLGQIAVACALGYFAVRDEEESWRQSRPLLSAWVDEFNRRESMQKTSASVVA